MKKTIKKQFFYLLLAGASIQIAKSQCVNATYNASTTNYLPKWNATAGCLSNSSITDNGAGSVVIGAALGVSGGDINISTGAKGLRLNSLMMLWNNNNNFNLYVGIAAGAIDAASYNTFVGGGAGNVNQAGGNNTFIGSISGVTNTTGANNSFLGSGSGGSNTTGGNNVFLGYLAGYSNTTNGSSIAIGASALYYNTAFGSIGIGSNALYNNSTGTQNIAMGFEALYSNTTGVGGTACGYQALMNSTGNYNTAYGRNAANNNTTGYNNTASGVNALYNTSTGYNNTGCGFSALSNNTTGYNNTALGYGANVGNVALNNATAIGYNASVTGSNDIVLGNSSITSIHAAVTTITAISDGRFKTNVIENVKGLEFIKKLRPVTYNLNTNALDDFIIQNLPDSLKTFHKQGMNFALSTAVIHSGFIAQEVEQAAQQVGFSSSIVYHPQNNSDPYGLGYAEFVVPLVKAVQELSKNADSLQTKKTTQDSINTAIQTALQKKINSQDSSITSLQNQINQLLASINACCASHTSKSMIDNTNSQTAANQTNVELNNKNIVVLDQNVPNPFAEQTTINYFLPENVTRAQIIFLDQSGKLIKAVDLTEKGKGQLNVFANDLTNGVYTYSLIVDGQTVETKKMMKTK